MVKISLILALFVFNSASTFALTQFPKGKCNLEGYIIKNKPLKRWIFIVNKGTNASTSFILDNSDSVEGLNETGQYRHVSIKLSDKVYSSYGKAEFVEVLGLVNPYEERKLYLSPIDVDSACNQ